MPKLGSRFFGPQGEFEIIVRWPAAEVRNPNAKGAYTKWDGLDVLQTLDEARK